MYMIYMVDDSLTYHLNHHLSLFSPFLVYSMKMVKIHLIYHATANAVKYGIVMQSPIKLTI